MVTSRRVGDDLNSVQSHSNVRRVGREKLLAQLDADTQPIGRLHDSITERHVKLASDLLDLGRQSVVLAVVVLVPRCKVSQLTLESAEVMIISAASQLHSRSCHHSPSTF